MIIGTVTGTGSRSLCHPFGEIVTGSRDGNEGVIFAIYAGLICIVAVNDAGGGECGTINERVTRGGRYLDLFVITVKRDAFTLHQAFLGTGGVDDRMPTS